MELLIKLLTVLVLGAVELWVAIPAGLALELSPSVTAITAASGGVLGLLVILTLGERIRNKLLKRVNREDKRNKYIDRLFFWMSLGIIICAIGLTIVVEFGLMGIESVMRS